MSLRLRLANNSPDIDEINEEMLIDFLKIVGLSKENKLPINSNKSTYMILGAICSHCILSICNISLFPALVLRARFGF